VVGVAADVKQHGLWKSSEPVVYRPLGLADIFKSPAHFPVVRTFEDTGRLAGSLKALIRSINAERPIVSVRTMEDVIFQSTARDRLRMNVVSLFGAAAFMPALAGVYAVVSYSVMLKQRKIGIRIALGGRPRRIQAMLLRRGAAIALRVPPAEPSRPGYSHACSAPNCRKWPPQTRPLSWHCR
jgi:hypothetical protein